MLLSRPFAASLVPALLALACSTANEGDIVIPRRIAERWIAQSTERNESLEQIAIAQARLQIILETHASTLEIVDSYERLYGPDHWEHGGEGLRWKGTSNDLRLLWAYGQSMGLVKEILDAQESLRQIQANALEHQWRMSNELYSAIRNELPN